MSPDAGGPLDSVDVVAATPPYAPGFHERLTERGIFGVKPGRANARKPWTFSRDKAWFKAASRPSPYNPLEEVNLAHSIELALLTNAQADPLSNLPPFHGAGIYAIYFNGDRGSRPYGPIASDRFLQPIYVGKAITKGARKGKSTANDNDSPLWSRLIDHAMSIEQAEDLRLEDFYCRHLVASDVFVPLAERLMIWRTRPVWNYVLDGFGNHDPGKRRYSQSASPWDELHPGRYWVSEMRGPQRAAPEEWAARIATHYADFPPQTEMPGVVGPDIIEQLLAIEVDEHDDAGD